MLTNGLYVKGDKMTNKTNEVLKHLQTKKDITSMEAIELYGATRLSAIIFNLKKKGYNIICRREECVDRYGNICRFGRYVLLNKQSEFGWYNSIKRFLK